MGRQDYMKDKINLIAFDADDTLWENENHFQLVEDQFCALLSDFGTKEEISHQLFTTEIKNLHLYGYGTKGMVLCMIEVINEITQGEGTLHCVSEVIKLGQELLQKPIELLDGVEDTLMQLSEKYRLVLATKGDLLDQQRKISNSGLQKYFSHIEIMSDKKVPDYQKMLNLVNCPPNHFLMVGNSVNSDIQPVLELGGYAVHIPYHTTWQHELHSAEITNSNVLQLNNIKELLRYL